MNVVGFRAATRRVRRRQFFSCPSRPPPACALLVSPSPLAQHHQSFSTSPMLFGGRQASHTEPKEYRRIQRRRYLIGEATKEVHFKDTPSRRSRLREMMRSQDLPQDLGIFAGTLIMPTGGNMPSFFRMPWYRTKMEAARISKRGKDLFSVFTFKYLTGWRKTKISFRKTAPTAMALHRQVYSAFADGDEEGIRKIACEGVRDKLINRIQARPDHTLYNWDLLRYRGRPRVVSHRATRLPLSRDDDDDNGESVMRQAVVRIKSVQKLTRDEIPSEDVDEKNLPDPEQTEKQVTEYVVIQKRVLRGIEEPWKFWGTTEETPLEKFNEALHAAGQGRAVLNS